MQNNPETNDQIEIYIPLEGSKVSIVIKSLVFLQSGLIFQNSGTKIQISNEVTFDDRSEGFGFTEVPDTISAKVILVNEGFKAVIYPPEEA